MYAKRKTENNVVVIVHWCVSKWCKPIPQSSVRTVKNRSITVDFELVLPLSGSCIVGSSTDVLSIVQRWQRGQNQQCTVLQDGHTRLITCQFLAITQPPNHRLRKTWKREEFRQRKKKNVLTFTVIITCQSIVYSFSIYPSQNGQSSWFKIHDWFMIQSFIAISTLQLVLNLFQCAQQQ